MKLKSRMDFPSCSSSAMNLRFYIDPQTNAPHIYNHGVDEEEVKAVLQRPGEDRLGRRFAGRDGPNR